MTETVSLTVEDVVELNPMFMYRWEEAQQAHILLYPEGVVKLNETAAAVLGQCQTRRPISAVIESLVTAYGAQDIDADVIDFLLTAQDKGWIKVNA